MSKVDIVWARASKMKVIAGIICTWRLVLILRHHCMTMVAMLLLLVLVTKYRSLSKHWLLIMLKWCLIPRLLLWPLIVLGNGLLRAIVLRIINYRCWMSIGGWSLRRDCWWSIEIIRLVEPICRTMGWLRRLGARKQRGRRRWCCWRRWNVSIR